MIIMHIYAYHQCNLSARLQWRSISVFIFLTSWSGHSYHPIGVILQHIESTQVTINEKIAKNRSFCILTAIKTWKYINDALMNSLRLLSTFKIWSIRSNRCFKLKKLAKNHVFTRFDAADMRKKYVPKILLTWNFQETLKVAWKV